MSKTMKEDKVREMLDQIGLKDGMKLSDGQLDEIAIALVSEINKEKDPEIDASVDKEVILKSRLAGEKDWKKRAAIAAQIISLNL